MTSIIRLDIATDQKRALKAEFDQLQSIEEKYNFWKEKLGCSYCFWAHFEQMAIQDFLIYSKTPDETEKLNKLLYEDGINYFKVRKENNVFLWKKRFIDQFENSGNKYTLVDYELRRIDEYIYSRKQTRLTDGDEYSKDIFFLAGYEDYLLNKKEFDWSERDFQTILLLEKIRGIEWAKYREFVASYSTFKTKKQDEIKLTGEQKFLILHYWEFGNEIKANTKKALLYDFFISELKQSTIRPMFSDIPRYETEENLNAIIDFFIFIGLNSKARDIQDKLGKLKKKR